MQPLRLALSKKRDRSEFSAEGVLLYNAKGGEAVVYPPRGSFPGEGKVVSPSLWRAFSGVLEVRCMRRDTGRGRRRENRRFALVRCVGCVTGRASVMKEGNAPRPYSKHGGLCRWVLPLLLSLVFHAALFFLPAGRHVPEPRPVLRLTLTRSERVSAPADPAGGARKGEPRVERPAPPPSARRKSEPPRRKPEARVEPSAKPKTEVPAEALPEARLPRDFEPVGGPAVREPTQIGRASCRERV